MNKPKICIVDDNVAVCHSLHTLFTTIYDVQFDVETYSNPVLFLDAHQSDWIGCLILDLFMPHWNGVDLMIELKRRHCEMCFIIASGHGNKHVAAEAIRAGARTFMLKPFNIDTLLKNVNDILYGPGLSY